MLDTLAATLSATFETSFWPPLVDRSILALNHLLRADEQASQRLVAHAGKSIRIESRAPVGPWPKPPVLRVAVTPAGLLEALPVAAPVEASADALTIVVELPAPLAAARMLAEGGRPATQIQGDTALAADVAWLAEHLRWDAEHDLAGVVGDVPARWLVMSGRAALAGLKRFADLARRARPADAADTGTAAPR